MQNFWEGKNVFVTGATGLLGSWLTKSLVDKKANVTILLRDIVPNSLLITSNYINKVNVAKGELEDYLTILRILNEYEIDTIFHLGAQAIVSTANRNPLSTFKSNIEGSWNVLEASRNSKLVQRIIVASSDKAYGENKTLPYTEQTPLQGSHPYDVSKSCVDLIAQAYHKTYSLPVAITRCGNIYGGGDLNFNRIVPQTIRHVIKKERPIIRSDGQYIRDYIYVEDIVKACLLLAGNLDRKEIQGQAFNFSIKNKVKVIEIVNLILKLMKSNLKPIILNEVKNEIKEQTLSSEKAKSLLNWQPSYSLEEGLKITIDWYKKYFKEK